MWKVSIILTIVLIVVSIEGSNFRMGSFRFLGDAVTMECNIDYGDFPILSITWSKDGKEFYQYDPYLVDPVIITQIEGVQIKTELSLHGNKITIGAISEESAGVYKCSVLIDHPTLDVGEMSGTLKIIQH